MLMTVCVLVVILGYLIASIAACGGTFGEAYFPRFANFRRGKGVAGSLCVMSVMFTLETMITVFCSDLPVYSHGCYQRGRGFGISGFLPVVLPAAVNLHILGSRTFLNDFIEKIMITNIAYWNASCKN